MSEAAVSGGVSRDESRLAALRRRLPLDSGESAVALRVVYAAVAAYAVLFLFAAVLHYAVFETQRFDLGDMVQAIWNTQHGHFLEATTANGTQQARLAAHVDPFLLLFVPLYWVWSSPLLLLVVQVLAVASGALPVFWLARKHLASPRAGAQFAFAYLLYPATQFNAFSVEDGFHPVSFAVPLVLYAVWLLDEDRLLAFSAVALLAFTTKEEIPLAVGCLGIWYAVRKGRRLFGLTVFGAGLAVTLFNFLWLIPHFSPTGGDPFAGRYRGVGGTPGGMAHKLVHDPTAFVHAVATGHKALYLGLLFVPFLGLCFLEPLLLLGAVPDLAINLLSGKAAQTTVIFQYTAGIVPFVIAASIFAVARFRRQAVQLSMWTLAAVAAVAIYSPLLLLPRDVQAVGSRRVAAKAHAVSLVPAGVPVSASNELGSRLSERRYVYAFPAVGHARWVAVDINNPTYANTRRYKRLVRKLERDTAWQVVFSSHGIAVLHKRSVGT